MPGLGTPRTLPPRPLTTSAFCRASPESAPPRWLPTSINARAARPPPPPPHTPGLWHLVADRPGGGSEPSPRQYGVETSRSRLASTTLFPSVSEPAPGTCNSSRPCARLVPLEGFFSGTLLPARCPPAAPSHSLLTGTVSSGFPGGGGAIAALHKFQFPQVVAPPGEMRVDALAQL